MVFYTPGRTTSYSSEKIETGIRFHFLGGAKEVGNVACVIEDNTQTRILVDYGLSPGDPPTYPQESPPIDATLITHAHLLEQLKRLENILRVSTKTLSKKNYLIITQVFLMSLCGV